LRHRNQHSGVNPLIHFQVVALPECRLPINEFAIAGMHFTSDCCSRPYGFRRKVILSNQRQPGPDEQITKTMLALRIEVLRIEIAHNGFIVCEACDIEKAEGSLLNLRNLKT
jgi:hypothetical protein